MGSLTQNLSLITIGVIWTLLMAAAYDQFISGYERRRVAGVLWTAILITMYALIVTIGLG